MNAKKFSDAMGELDGKYVEEALRRPQKARKPRWVKWSVLAACLAIAAVLGIARSGLLGGRTDSVTLESGEELVFVRADAVGASLDIAGTITTRELTAEEAAAVFPGLTVTGHATYQTLDADAVPELIGLEGQIGEIKLVVSASNVQLLDAVVEGTETTSRVLGTDVTAGYFLTDRNSSGERYVIYYADFAAGGCRVYLEHAGPYAERETLKMQLAEVLETIVENGGPDLTALPDADVP